MQSPCIPAFLAGVVWCVALAASARAAEPVPVNAVGLALFRDKIEPVLRKHCYTCHSAQGAEVEAGLRLDSRAAIRQGGDSGPAVTPGDKQSLLLQAIRHAEGLKMPPEAPKLSAAIIADFEQWVALGAPDPREPVAEGPPRADPRTHWAFQPVRKVEPPATDDAGGKAWATSPIDAFVWASLAAKGWRPAPPAEPGEWLRRVTFDLTGLPPTPDEVREFVADPSPTARAKVVDRLLASPHYGERWAQHWLDVVRYAETEGYEYDRHVPDAWRFRDYVIESFQRDKPLDQFLREQLAGDELEPNNPEFQTAAIFHRLGPVRRNAGNPDIALSRNEVLTERTDVIGTAFLALSVGCARCHNHKLEPISQQDYYRLQAYLAATDEHNVALTPPAERAEWEAETARIKAELKKLQEAAKTAEGEAKTRIDRQLDELEDTLPPPLPTIPSTHNNEAVRTPIHVLKRGVWEQKGQRVGPRPLSILIDDKTPELPADVRDPRTQLARWLTNPAHPLTPRVLVNRIWQGHFGAGLVATANDFGQHGARPSHPELLDWLASEFLAGGWRMKPLHRMIVLSNTYAQSSRAPAGSSAGPQSPAVADPENRLLWRFNRRRLSAEELRDAMLAIAGRLNTKAGGPSVMTSVEPELVNQLYKPKQWEPAADAREHDRRSIYLLAKRNLRLPFMETFDAPALLSSCARREASTHAPQALEMLNGRLANELAGALALRLEREAGEGGTAASFERLVERGFWLAAGRAPTATERERSLAFLQGARDRNPAVREFALALFNLNGFLYVP